MQDEIKMRSRNSPAKAMQNMQKKKHCATSQYQKKKNASPFFWRQWDVVI